MISLTFASLTDVLQSNLPNEIMWIAISLPTFLLVCDLMMYWPYLLNYVRKGDTHLRQKANKDDDDEGNKRWNFIESWASILTPVGAVLGVVLTDYPNQSGKTLGLFFGILIILAPFLCDGLSQLFGASNKKVYVFAFFVGSTFTLIGVIGELGTTILLLQLLEATMFSDMLTDMLQGVLVFIILLAVVYDVRTTGSTVKSSKDRKTPLHKLFQHIISALHSTYQTHVGLLLCTLKKAVFHVHIT